MVKDAITAGAKVVGVAVGISGDFVERAQACLKSGASFVCIDVAHGHHILMMIQLYFLRYYLGDFYSSSSSLISIPYFNMPSSRALISSLISLRV